MTTLDNYGYIYSGKWHRLKGGARQAWGQLTGNKMTRVAGQQEYLLGVLQEKYGYTRQEAQRALANLSSTASQKKTELADALQATKAWIDDKRGVTRRRSRAKKVAGLAAAAVATGALAYYFGRVRPDQAEAVGL